MRGGGETAGPRADVERVAVLKGGTSLERKVSLRSGAQAQEALSRLGHDVVAIDAGPELVTELREAEPDAAFIALHGSDGEDGTVQGLLEAIAPAPRRACAARTRCSPSISCARRAFRRRTFTPFGSPHSKAWARRGLWRMWSGVWAFRWSSSRRARARRWA